MKRVKEGVERKRKEREGMNELGKRGLWREKRCSRPTSSENSSPVEFLISPRHPHLTASRRSRDGKNKGTTGRAREKRGRKVGSQGGERTDVGGGVDEEGAALSCARFSETFPPPSADTPVFVHTLPRVAFNQLHPLAPTERAAATVAAAAPFS